MVVIPVQGKDTNQLSLGLVDGFNQMGHKPKVILTDNERAMTSDTIQDYLREQDIEHIIVRNHPHMAERAIRTIKNLIYARLENTNKQWTDHDVLYASVLKYNKENNKFYCYLAGIDTQGGANDVSGNQCKNIWIINNYIEQPEDGSVDNQIDGMSIYYTRNLYLGNKILFHLVHLFLFGFLKIF
jgi:hypothetical protein